MNDLKLIAPPDYLAGPWEVSATGIWARSPWNARVKLAEVTVFSSMNHIDWRANARLMAAAPALHRSLIAVMEGSEFKTLQGIPHWSARSAPTEEALYMGRAALALVSGVQP